MVRFIDLMMKTNLWKFLQKLKEKINKQAITTWNIVHVKQPRS